jgi:predicted TIM-barrel fold metal-dependent hydrolase
MIPGVTASETEAFAANGYAEMFAVTREVGMPMFLFIGGQVELVPPYLEAFPEVEFIIDHCGMPLEAGLSLLGAETPAGEAADAGPDVAYFDEVLKLAAYPNVALKWSHAQGMFGELEYPSPGLIPYLRRAIDAFGAERIMWASDAGGGNQTGETWEQLLHYLLDSDGISDEEKSWIFGRSVRKSLNWPSP